MDLAFENPINRENSSFEMLSRKNQQPETLIRDLKSTEFPAACD